MDDPSEKRGWMTHLQGIKKLLCGFSQFTQSAAALTVLLYLSTLFPNL